MKKARTKNYEVPAGRLWPNMSSGAPVSLEVFGATGEYKSGKTLLGLSLAPGAHPNGHKFAGEPRTLYLDFEKSGGTYSGTGVKRIDVPSLLESQGTAYTPINVFKWFLQIIKSTEAGRFDVIVADPITDIESGLVEFVKSNSTMFTLSANQIAKGGGLLWGAVKSFWKQVLLILATRCQTFFFTAHLRDEWSGDRPTGRREPKGKDTLMELASLYLWLERLPNDQGIVVPVPSAIVVKERLSDTLVNGKGELEIVPLMPARLPEATAAAIRRYIANPPDLKRPRMGEKVVPKKLMEEERLRLEVARAEAEKATEESRLERLSKMADLQTAQRAAQDQEAKQPAKATDQTAERQAAKASKREAEAEQKSAEADQTEAPDELSPAAKLLEKAFQPTMPGKATRTQQRELFRLFDVAQIGEDTQAALLGRVNAATVEDLSKEHACLLIEKLATRVKNMEGQAASSGN